MRHQVSLGGHPHLKLFYILSSAIEHSRREGLQVKMHQKSASATGELLKTSGVEDVVNEEQMGMRPVGEKFQTLVFVLTLLLYFRVYYSELLNYNDLGVGKEGTFRFPFYKFRRAVLWVEGHLFPSYIMP